MMLLMVLRSRRAPRADGERWCGEVQVRTTIIQQESKVDCITCVCLVASVWPKGILENLLITFENVQILLLFVDL